MRINCKGRARGSQLRTRLSTCPAGKWMPAFPLHCTLQHTRKMKWGRGGPIKRSFTELFHHWINEVSNFNGKLNRRIRLVNSSCSHWWQKEGLHKYQDRRTPFANTVGVKAAGEKNRSAYFPPVRPLSRGLGDKSHPCCPRTVQPHFPSCCGGRRRPVNFLAVSFVRWKWTWSARSDASIHCRGKKNGSTEAGNAGKNELKYPT